MAKIKINKLLKNLGGKPVNIIFRSVKSGIPMITGILLDEDEHYYYIGDNLEVSVAVRKVETQMVMDAEVALNMQEEEIAPRGTKYQ